MGNSPAGPPAAERACAAMATRSRASVLPPSGLSRAGFGSLERPGRKLGLKAKGLCPHHHSNSPMALSPKTSPPVQFPGQGHRGFQTHMLKSRGPRVWEPEERSGQLGHWHCHMCPECPQALSLPSWLVSCSLSWNSGPSQAEAHRPGAAWEPCAPLTRAVGRPRDRAGAGAGADAAAGSGFVHVEQSGTRRWAHQFPA